MKKNKGFTLVELISVLVILILLFLVAVAAVRKNIENSELKATKATAIQFVKGTNDIVAFNNSDLTNPIISGLYTYDQLVKLGLKMDGKKPENGYAYIYDGRVISACIDIENHKVNFLHGKYKDAISGTCKTTEGYNRVTRTHSIPYTGSEKTVTLNESGKYVVEAWGAQGGNANNNYPGGYGAYARTEFFLDNGETLTLYINVGGKGKNGCNRSNCVGGYNGGTDSGTANSSALYYGSGGGATSVALQSGLLSTLEDNKDKVILVAGGGGGASYVNNSSGNKGGAGGGFIGGSSLTTETYVNGLYYGSGGTQTHGGMSSFTSSTEGSFGKGGELISTIGDYASSGAGGGYYGGGYAGGGGSSYYATSFVVPSSSREVETTKSVVYCYECSESKLFETRTVKTTGINKEALSGRVREGHGFVRITKVEE